MATRRLIVEIVGDDASLQRSLAGAGASTAGFGDRIAAISQRTTALGKTLTMGLTLPIVAVGAASTKLAVDFQNSMELIHTQAGVSQKAVESLSKSVLALAGPTATAPDTLSAGLYHLTSQGLRGSQALDALKASAEGAKMGQADLEDVTNAMGAAVASNIRGVTDYNRVMGIFNATVGAGDMRMEDLAKALGTGLLTQAKQAGVGIQDVSAALATFGDNNIRGAKAGTLLSSALRLMSSPSSTAAKHLGEFGISAQTLSNTLQNQGLPAAVGYLKDRIDALGPSSFAAKEALTQGFGGKQSTGVRLLVDEFERLKTKEDAVAKGGSSFASDWTAYTKTTAYQLASAGAQMESMGASLGTILLPIVAKIADVVGSLAARFEALSPSVQKVILVVGGVVAALGPVLYVLGNLGTVLTFLAANPIVLVIAGVVALTAAIAAAVIWPDKLKSVLEQMGLSAHAAGEIVRGLQAVFEALKPALAELVNAFRTSLPMIAGIVRDAVDIILTLWRTFGSTLVSVAKTYIGYVAATIRNLVEIIRGVFDVVDGLIHGRWSQVWQGMKEIVGGVLKQIEAMFRTWMALLATILGEAAHLLGAAASRIGTAVYKGIVQPLLKLGAEVLSDIKNAIESAFHTIVGWVVGAAEAIGKGITSGIMHGIGNLAGGLANTIKSHLSGALGAVKSFAGIFSPSTLFAAQVGRPIAQGIIAGYIEGAAALPSKLTASVRSALEAARSQVAAYQGKFASAFAGLVKTVNQAMGGAVAASSTAAGKQLAGLLAQYQSPTAGPVSGADTEAGKQLAAMQAAYQDQQRQLALTNANSQLSGATGQLSTDQAAGADATTLAADQAAIVAARQAVADATEQINEAALQAQANTEAASANSQAAALKTQAAAEAKHETAMNQLRKRNADQALAALEKRLGKEGATQKQAQDAIVKLLKKYGVTYHDVAVDMGKKFAKGLEESIGLTAKAAEELAKEIAKYLPHSPAEKGPLAKPIGWQSFLLMGLDDPGLRGKLGSTVGSIVGAAVAGPAAGGVVVGGRSGGAGTAGGTLGPVTFNVSVVAPNYMGDRHDLEDGVVNALSRWARSNGRSELRALLGAATG